MPVSLSKRLTVIAELCRGAKRVIDVGCDHGKLAARLLQDDSYITAVATDISPDSLEKARILITSLGLEDRCDCICCDGLEKVELIPGDLIVLSGMGPEVIDRIIETAEPRMPADIRLVLSPASHHERLRAAAARRGFVPVREYAVAEQGRFYTPGLYVRSESKRLLSPGESASGIITPDYTDGISYLRTVRERYRKISFSSNDPEKLDYSKKVCEHIDALLAGAKH